MDMAEQEDLHLDDAKEFIFVALRSQERFSSNLSALVTSLDKIKEGEDEWLLQASTSPIQGCTMCAM